MSNLQQAAAVLDTPRTFVDLREFAQDKSQGVAVSAQTGDDRFLSSRRVLDWAAGPVTAGVITLEAGRGAVQSLAADEFIIVHAGQITLSQQGLTVTLQPGQSGWESREHVAKVYVIYRPA